METFMQLAVIQICVDLTLQPRIAGLDAAHVQELEGVSKNWPPLAVVAQGENYVLVDGFHRYAAAQNLGLDQVPVRVLDYPEDGDLHALAFALNAIHGRPLTLTDRRTYAVRLLRQHPEWSDREIGRRCGLTQPPVAKLREELEQAEEIAPTDTRVGRDGQVYKIRIQPTKRLLGNLPEPPGQGLMETLFTPQERREQRRIAQYLERLSVALEDQQEFEAWKTSRDAAEACRKVFDEDRVAELAQTLGDYSANILDVARVLGYVEGAARD